MTCRFTAFLLLITVRVCCAVLWARLGEPRLPITTTVVERFPGGRPCSRLWPLHLKDDQRSQAPECCPPDWVLRTA